MKITKELFLCRFTDFSTGTTNVFDFFFKCQSKSIIPQGYINDETLHRDDTVLYIGSVH